MTKRILVAMPMKAFAQAKGRLARMMTDGQRERLAQTLFLRTHEFFATHFGAFDRLVVTPCPGVQRICGRIGVHVLREPGAQGLNVASGRAIQWATVHGYTSVLLIPGDVPVWSRSEVSHLLEQARSCDVVVAQAYDGGTNALLLSLPTAFQCAYGVNSSVRHVRHASAAGLRAVVCKLPFLAHDLDVPTDCSAFLHSQRLTLEQLWNSAAFVA